MALVFANDTKNIYNWIAYDKWRYNLEMQKLLSMILFRFFLRVETLASN